MFSGWLGIKEEGISRNSSISISISISGSCSGSCSLVVEETRRAVWNKTESNDNDNDRDLTSPTVEAIRELKMTNQWLTNHLDSSSLTLMFL